MTKLIKVMDTSFRDGFQSIFGAKVLVDDFIPALQAAVDAGIKHFETAGGARFQAPIFFCNENAFETMDKIREEYKKRAKFLNENVSVKVFDKTIEGEAVDITENGALKLKDKTNKEHILLIGDIL